MLILSLSLEGKSNKLKLVILSFWLQIPLIYDSVSPTWGCPGEHLFIAVRDI